MIIRSATMNVMTRAAQKAGRALVRDFGEVEQLQVSRKGPADFVSTADKKAEKILRDELLKGRPDYSLLMEESGGHEGKDPDRRFIVDPLDGTTNFLHGLPHWAVSVGYEERGELVAGVIFDPIKDELFWAERGKGAYLNDRRIRVSGRRRLSDAVVATGIPHLGIQEGEGQAQFLRRLEKAMASCAGVRRWGTASLDLAYVAAGRYDAFWERGLSAWDVAAGVVIVREAGGFALDSKGKTFKLDAPDILAVNDSLQKPLVDMLRAAG
ncbi:MAG: inositol monophosphatase [Alphaproteobacteria bacterium]|nr:inositol monophosphatase [Alphaproteobacteria bacterium]